MEPLITRLTEVRKQLVAQQSSINDCLKMIDALIIDQINPTSGQDELAPKSTTREGVSKKFPPDIETKRAKIQFILLKAPQGLTAKEVKDELLRYGFELANVDQTLVNLEKAKRIESTVVNGRKKYFRW